MTRSLGIGALCFLLGAAAAALAATTGLRPETFIARAWTWTRHQGVQPAALSDGASITVDGTDANAYTLTIAGNSHTLACPSTVSYGAYAFRFLNSGGATGFAVASCYKFAGGVAPSWSSANGKYDVMTCQAFDNSRLECAALIDVH